MYDAVMEHSADADIIIKAAAVADYTPVVKSDEKIKKSDDDMSIALERTNDILKALGAKKRDNQVICGFSMETNNMLENSRKKLISKNCDMIAANNLKDAGAGFGVDTNLITLITANEIKELDLMSKKEAGHKILDEALRILSEKQSV